MNWPLSLNKPAVSQQLGQLIYSYPYSWGLEWSVYVSIPLSLKMQIKANKRGFNFSSSLPHRLRPVIYSCSVRRGQLLVLGRSAQQSRSGLSVEMFVSFAQKADTRERGLYSVFLIYCRTWGHVSPSLFSSLLCFFSHSMFFLMASR